MIVFLVVLYNKPFDDSKTLQTLCQLFPEKPQTNVFIWNNGPDSLKESVDDSLVLQTFKAKGITFELRESLENKSLSAIYNDVWENCTGMLSILDDDTELNDRYFRSVERFLASSCLVMVPKIQSQDQLVYPRSKQLNFETIQDYQVVDEPIVSVMSGICVKAELKQTLLARYGDLFDQRFCFYGIDSIFFKRLKILKKSCFFIGGAINHSLSSASFCEPSEFRVRERLIDSCLQLRNYPSLGACKGFLLTLREFGFKHIWRERKLMLISLWHGSHPRFLK